MKGALRYKKKIFVAAASNIEVNGCEEAWVWLRMKSNKRGWLAIDYMQNNTIQRMSR